MEHHLSDDYVNDKGEIYQWKPNFMAIRLPLLEQGCRRYNCLCADDGGTALEIVLVDINQKRLEGEATDH